METLERIIAEHPFFAGLESYYTNLLTGCASNVRFDAGTYIFKEGEEANEFYLIRSGKVHWRFLRRNANRSCWRPWARERFWAGRGCCRPTCGSSTRVPSNPCARSRLTASVLRTKCEQNHDLGYEMLKRFAGIMEQRLEATLLQLLDVYAVR